MTIKTRFEYDAIVTKVYDGDTIWADVDLGFYTWVRSVTMRLAEIDTPEIRGEERPQGLIVRDIVREKILNKQVLIVTDKDKRGKYGRWLATIFIEGENLNEWLVEHGHAVRWT